MQTVHAVLMWYSRENALTNHTVFNKRNFDEGVFLLHRLRGLHNELVSTTKRTERLTPYVKTSVLFI